MKLLEVLGLRKCEYAPLCKLYRTDSYDCNKARGEHCGRHRHRKQIEAIGHHA